LASNAPLLIPIAKASLSDQLTQFSIDLASRGVVLAMVTITSLMSFLSPSTAADSMLEEIRAARSSKPGPHVLDVTDIVQRYLNQTRDEREFSQLLKTQGFTITATEKRDIVSATCGIADKMLVAKRKLSLFDFVGYDEVIIIGCVQSLNVVRSLGKVVHRNL
jgi:hypothetical protein